MQCVSTDVYPICIYVIRMCTYVDTWICLCTYTSMHACTSICIYKTMPGHVHMFTCICRPICMKKKKYEEEICLFNIVCSYTYSAM